MIQSDTNVTHGKSVFEIIRKKFPTIFLLFSLHETDWSTRGLVYLHLPSVCSRTFFRTWVNHKTTCKTPNIVMECLRTSDRTCDPLETAYMAHGRRWFPLLGICVFGPILKEKTKKTTLWNLFIEHSWDAACLPMARHPRGHYHLTSHTKTHTYALVAVTQ